VVDSFISAISGMITMQS